MVIMDVVLSVIGAYVVYKLEKIDRRQDEIEIELKVMSMRLPKRKGDTSEY